MKRPPSAVCPSTTGCAIRAAAETATNRTMPTAELTITTRRRPRRPTRTSPARPEAASTPMTATVATTRANSASSQPGTGPSSTESASAPASKNWANAITVSTTSRPIANSDSRSTTAMRSAKRPRTFAAGDEGQRQPGQEDLQQAVVQVLPEDREVVADDDRGGRHDDQVVEQDGPAGDEAPELVEGVAGERRGAAALGMQRVALEVGGARDHQEGSGQQVDERREAERVAGDHPQREEDRRDDRAQHDREQRGHAQPACDPVHGEPGAAPELLARPAGHRRAALAAGVAHRRSPPPGQPQAPGAEQDEHDPQDHPEGERPAALRERRHHHGHPDQEKQPAEHPGRGQVGALHGRNRRPGRSATYAGLAAVSARAVPAVDSARGVDDHPAGALGEHRLERAAEQRAAGAPRRAATSRSRGLGSRGPPPRCAARPGRGGPSPSARSPAARRGPGRSRSARRPSTPARASRRRWASSAAR